MLRNRDDENSASTASVSASGLSGFALHRRRLYRHGCTVSEVDGPLRGDRLVQLTKPSACYVVAEPNPIVALFNLTRNRVRSSTGSACPGAGGSPRLGAPHPPAHHTGLLIVGSHDTLQRNGSGSTGSVASGVIVRLVQWSDRVGGLSGFGDR